MKKSCAHDFKALQADIASCQTGCPTSPASSLDCVFASQNDIAKHRTGLAATARAESRITTETHYAVGLGLIIAFGLL